MSIKHVAKRILMRNSLASLKRKNSIIKFAKKFGFVYFGHVDQHDDEHHVIRGLTVSSTHQDEGYSVGSFDGYDVSVVDRLDVIESHDKKIKSHRWVIIEIDLHKGNDVPHIFLGAHDHRDSSYSKLFTSVNIMQSVPLGTLENHSEEFIRRYSLFSSPSQFIDVERLFTAEVTRTIAAHFWPLAVEIIDGSLYVYSDTINLTSNVLEAMLKNGLWLAEQIDERAFSSVNVD
jgi:hypothetical protein